MSQHHACAHCGGEGRVEDAEGIERDCAACRGTGVSSELRRVSTRVSSVLVERSRGDALARLDDVVARFGRNRDGSP